MERQHEVQELLTLRAEDKINHHIKIVIAMLFHCLESAAEFVHFSTPTWPEVQFTHREQQSLHTMFVQVISFLIKG